MPITEFLFPALKNDKASIEAIARIAPIFRKKLTYPNPGFLSGFRGFIVTENEKDVRDDFREIVIFGKSGWCLIQIKIYDLTRLVQNGTGWTLFTAFSNQCSLRTPYRPSSI